MVVDEGQRLWQQWQSNRTSLNIRSDTHTNYTIDMFTKGQDHKKAVTHDQLKTTLIDVKSGACIYM